MEDLVGMKELFDVNIRLNNPITIGNRAYDINETILSFDKAQIAQFQQNKTKTYARGGYQNRMLVDWETEKECNFAITHGVLSPLSWAVLTNSKITERKNKSVQYKESLQVTEGENENGDFWYVDLKFIPNGCEEPMGLQYNPDNEPMPMGRKPWLPLKPQPPRKDIFIFCYDEETGQKIKNFEILGNRIIFKAEHRKVVVDYTFNYDDKYREISVGNRLFTGELNLTAKMTTKDYVTGEPRTAILFIPRLKIDSNLVMKLGTYEDDPVISNFYFTGYPGEGRRPEDEAVCSITFLDSELTGDYV